MIIARIKTGLIIGGIGAAVGFGGGWFTNGWRWEAKFADAQLAAVQTYETMQKELNAKFAEQVERDTTARMALSRNLRESRAHAQSVLEELETLRLSPNSPQIETILVEQECRDDQTRPAVVIANPFNDDFVRLWNSSASGIIAGGAAPP
jgi:hypothetical protein